MDYYNNIGARIYGCLCSAEKLRPVSPTDYRGVHQWFALIVIIPRYPIHKKKFGGTNSKIFATSAALKYFCLPFLTTNSRTGTLAVALS